VSSWSESDTSEHWREVVGVVGDGVLLTSILVGSQNSRSDSSVLWVGVSGSVQELFEELGVGFTVVVLSSWLSEISTSDGSVSFRLEMSKSTDTRLLSENVSL